MRRLDELHLEHPFMGARMLRDQLWRGYSGRPPACDNADGANGHQGPGAVARHEQARVPGHKIYPYLLRHLAITRPNQLWALEWAPL